MNLLKIHQIKHNRGDTPTNSTSSSISSLFEKPESILTNLLLNQVSINKISQDSQFLISKLSWTMKFRNVKTENEFAKFYYGKKLWKLKVISILATILWACFIYVDVTDGDEAFRSRVFFWMNISLRITSIVGGIVSTLILFIIPYTGKAFQYCINIIIMIMVVVLGICVTTMSNLYNEDEFSISIGAPATMAAAFLTLKPMSYSCVFCCILIITNYTFWVFFQSGNIAKNVIIGYAIAFASVIVSSATIVIFHEISMRKLFINIQKVEEVKTNIKEQIEMGNLLLKNLYPKRFINGVLKKEKRMEFYKNINLILVDLVSFTKFSSKISAEKVVSILNIISKGFDSVCKVYEIDLVKSLGDGMEFCDMSKSSTNNTRMSSIKCVNFSLDLQKSLKRDNLVHGWELEMRIGVVQGTCFAVSLGKVKQFDIYSTALFKLRKAERICEPGKIAVCEEIRKRSIDFFIFEKIEKEDFFQVIGIMDGIQNKVEICDVKENEKEKNKCLDNNYKNDPNILLSITEVHFYGNRSERSVLLGIDNSDDEIKKKKINPFFLRFKSSEMNKEFSDYNFIREKNNVKVFAFVSNFLMLNACITFLIMKPNLFFDYKVLGLCFILPLSLSFVFTFLYLFCFLFFLKKSNDSKKKKVSIKILKFVSICFRILRFSNFFLFFIMVNVFFEKDFLYDQAIFHFMVLLVIFANGVSSTVNFFVKIVVFFLFTVLFLVLFYFLFYVNYNVLEISSNASCFVILIMMSFENYFVHYTGLRIFKNHKNLKTDINQFKQIINENESILFSSLPKRILEKYKTNETVKRFEKIEKGFILFLKINHNLLECIDEKKIILLDTLFHSFDNIVNNTKGCIKIKSTFDLYLVINRNQKLENENDSKNAEETITCALDLIKESKKYNVPIRIALNGPCSFVGGIIGNKNRVLYDIVGDNVNLCSRICDQAKNYQLLTHYKNVNNLRSIKNLRYKSIGNRLLKGKGSFELFEIGIKQYKIEKHSFLFE